jgi:hypothetical protein
MHASSEGIPNYVFLVAGAGFISLWCVNSLFASWQSGWKLLSIRFRTESEFLGEVKRGRYPFDLCLRNWFDYTNIVWVAPEEDALYLSVVFPFRIGHPPLRIPWAEIDFSRTNLLWRRYLVLYLGQTERIPMRISEHMARSVGILERVPLLSPGTPPFRSNTAEN